MIKEDPGNPYLKTSGFFTSLELFCCTLFLSIILARNKNRTVSKLLQFNLHLNQNINQPVLIWQTASWVRCETTGLSASPPQQTLSAFAQGKMCPPTLTRGEEQQLFPSCQKALPGKCSQHNHLECCSFPLEPRNRWLSSKWPSPKWSFLQEGGALNYLCLCGCGVFCSLCWYCCILGKQCYLDGEYGSTASPWAPGAVVLLSLGLWRWESGLE